MKSTVLSRDQLECLSSPARSDVFISLRSMRQASARELAERLGRSPATVHYHLDGLAKVGLVREAFRRATSRKPESVFEPVHRRLELPKPGEEPESHGLVQRTVLAGLRQVMRGYKAASDMPLIERRRIHVLRMQMRLAPEDAETFLQMIEAAQAFATAKSAEDGLALHWSSLVYPDTSRVEKE